MPLTSLFVRDFAIVRELELEPGPGLTVLTGETGAGKSILIDALALGLGARADGGAIRHGTDSAEVLTSFQLQPDDDAARWLDERDLNDGPVCITRRMIYRDKPSRAYINGRPATVQMLKELGIQLVDIHGQHEHQSLMRRETQRSVLDEYAGIQAKVQQLSALYDQLQSLRTSYNHLSEAAEDRTARTDMLRYQIDELVALDTTETEFHELEVEQRRLAHASELIEGMHFVTQMLHEAEDSSAVSFLARCIQRLDALAGFAPEIEEIRSLLDVALVQVEEAGIQLNQQLNKVELDPQRLTWTEQRIQSLLDLARKHRCEAAALPVRLQELQAELGEIENAGSNLAELEIQISDTETEYKHLAGEISACRQEAAGRLSSAVTANMQELGMAGGKFDVAIRSLADEFTRFGTDRIEYQVSANAGQPLRPLGKVASGGELSRISLALQVVIAAVGHIPTLVFDEVDVGIGGGVAEIVGQKLRLLGQSRQVLCITHLAQVASQGLAHLQIGKKEMDGVVVEVRLLDEQSRQNEIARMLGGIEITDKTRAHAKDMLSRASLEFRK
jgi:DNA repair protein RecN (Recombination protein N)